MVACEVSDEINERSSVGGLDCVFSLSAFTTPASSSSGTEHRVGRLYAYHFVFSHTFTTKFVQ